MPEGGAVQTIPGAQAESPRASTTEERIAFGRRVYTANCVACHQANGEGIPGGFPPLAGSDFLNADKNRAIGALINGLDGVITVNGNVFDGVMPALRLSDDEVANVLTYVYSEWGNAGLVVLPSDVGPIRR
jgi:nitrite reductase (NO-forming)